MSNKIQLINRAAAPKVIKSALEASISISR
jgi:hypothetical protein